MQRKTKLVAAIIGAGITTALVLSAGVGSAISAFSDMEQGNVSGTVGSIKITGSGGGGLNNLDLAYTDLLPGTPQTVTLNYQNTGKNAQDVWVVFNNPAALHALNDLGTYGEFHIAGNGTAVFDSANLNDNAKNSCGPISPAGCWPVPGKIKVASDVAPGATGSASFTFAYASKLSGQSENGGGVWNSYPGGSGLPYQLVAVQVGNQP